MNDEKTPVVPMCQDIINRLMNEEQLRLAEMAILSKLKEEGWVISSRCGDWVATPPEAQR